MGLTSQSLRPSSQRSEPQVAKEYLATVIGPGRSVGPQGQFRTLDELLEFVRDNVENGAVVTATSN